MSPEERRRGVVASSAGNHAQGVALAATMLEIPSRIYMPMDAPLAKQLATKQYGAEIVLEGESFDDAQAAARRDANGRTLRLGVRRRGGRRGAGDARASSCSTSCPTSTP